VTVTSLDEARHATAAGADLLVVQGYEAGGHRGGSSDSPQDTPGLSVSNQVHLGLFAWRYVRAC
jgi:nitronate monooxygenase